MYDKNESDMNNMFQDVSRSNAADCNIPTKETLRLNATLARRNVYSEEYNYVSMFDEMNEEQKEAFREEAHKQTAGMLKRRKLRKKITIVTGTVIVVIIALLAIFPIFFTFLDSFMSSTEIKNCYSSVFQSLSGQASQSGGVAKYLTKMPMIRLIPEKVTISQYITLLFMSPTYLLKFWNSIIMVVPIVLGQVMISLGASYSFTRYRKKRREVLLFSYLILMLMPFQVTLVPNYYISEKLNLLGTFWAIILPGIFSTFSVFLFTKYMRQIPKAYFEAAIIDGASDWQIFTKIVMPSCKSAIYAIIILLFIDYWNMVEQPVIFLKEQPDKFPLSVFLSQINSQEVGIAFAASALYMIPALLIFLLGEDYLVEGISRSGVK